MKKPLTKKKLTKKDIKVISNPNKKKKLTMNDAQDFALTLKKDINKIISLGMQVCSDSKMNTGETATILLNALSMATGDTVLGIYKQKDDRLLITKTYTNHLIKQVKNSCE